MIQGLRTVVLYCADTEVSRRWYERVGFAYDKGYEGMHWFRLGDARVMLHPAEPGEVVRPPELAVTVDDVDQQFRVVQEAGLEPFDHGAPGARLAAPVNRPWGERDFSLQDPDGYRWSFVQG